MRSPHRAIALVLFSFSASLFAADTTSAPAAVGNAALVGRWQPGLTAEVRKLPQAQWQNYTRGGLFEVLADHRFRVYPNCGREKKEWEKRGLPFGEGKWEVIGPNKLRVVLAHQGEKAENEVEFELKGDELIFSSPSNSKEQFGRFQGEASTRCDGR